MKVVLASKNPHKLVEIDAITRKLGIELILQSRSFWMSRPHSMSENSTAHTSPVCETEKWLKPSIYGFPISPVFIFSASPAAAEASPVYSAIADASSLRLSSRPPLNPRL